MKRYRLTESRLRSMIKEAVKSALNEDIGDAAVRIGELLVGLDESTAKRVGAEILWLVTKGTRGGSLEETIDNICASISDVI